MMITEEEARQKQCPFDRVSLNGDVDYVKCLASDCMAWRWQCTTGVTYESISGQRFGIRNFITCDTCDSEDVTKKWIALHKEFYSDRFWALRP